MVKYFSNFSWSSKNLNDTFHCWADPHRFLISKKYELQKNGSVVLCHSVCHCAVAMWQSGLSRQYLTWLAAGLWDTSSSFRSWSKSRQSIVIDETQISSKWPLKGWKLTQHNISVWILWWHNVTNCLEIVILKWKTEFCLDYKECHFLHHFPICGHQLLIKWLPTQHTSVNREQRNILDQWSMTNTISN